MTETIAKKNTIVEEISTLDKNEAWDIMELLARSKPIGNKWMFKKKLNVEGKIEK